MKKLEPHIRLFLLAVIHVLVAYALATGITYLIFGNWSW